MLGVRVAAAVGVAVVVSWGAAGCADETLVSSGAPHHTAHEEGAAVEVTTTLVRPERLDIVAVDFSWSGLPDVLPAGSYPMSFRNEGTEGHEISIFRNPDRLALEELAALGPVKIKDVVEPVGMLIAGPGNSAEPITVELTPGTYEVVCFIPSAAGDGTAHFDHGMHRTLTVV